MMIETSSNVVYGKKILKNHQEFNISWMINMEDALKNSLPHLKAEFTIFVSSLTKLSNYKQI